MPINIPAFYLGALPILVLLCSLPFLKNKAKNLLLCLASLVLYVFAGPIWAVILLVVALCNYLCVLLAVKSPKLAFLRVLAIIADVGVLLFFKVANSALGAVGPLAALLPASAPLGISYFVFLAISFVVDSRQLDKTPSPIGALLYLFFFPSIASGPITQYRNFAPQLETRSVTKEQFLGGIERFAFGLIKKVLLADTIGVFVKYYLLAGQFSAVLSWLAAIGYTVQIYLDFSGFSDMAIGIGRIFGFSLAENFNYPYTAVSVSDFWSRWHISLTKWFTKYVYIPLGGNRVSPARHIFNLFAVWLLTSLWHGFGWTFLIWGMTYFIFQLLEKKTPLGKIHGVPGRIYTLLIVILTWVFFRAGSLSQAFSWLGSMFGFGNAGFCSAADLHTYCGYLLPLGIGAVLCFPVYPKLMQTKLMQRTASKLVFAILLFVLFVLTVCIQLTTGYSAPLYAGF